MKSRVARFLLGFVTVSGVLIAAFSLLMPAIHRWGATLEEVDRSLPGDDILPDPIVDWTHAATIHASPEAVWPWVAQLGERRGGYYSYTFIENLIARQRLYHNANRIIPEFQRPAPGDELIGPNMLLVKAVEPGSWMLAESSAFKGWTWLWSLDPLPNGDTRLVIRMKIQPEGVAIPAAATALLDAGGFIMEKRMIQGIKDRAEGRFDPPWSEPAEIALWFTTLLEGLAAAGLFISRRDSWRSLPVGVSAVLVLLVLTFVQPALWIRAILNLGLLAGLWWARRRPAASTMSMQPVVPSRLAA